MGYDSAKKTDVTISDRTIGSVVLIRRSDREADVASHDALGRITLKKGVRGRQGIT
jgi:hypothetical protein